MTDQERLIRLEERMESLDTKVDRNYNEQLQFHNEVLTELRALSNEKIQIATLKEKVKTLEKITWFALLTAVGALIKATIDLVTGK